MPPMKRTSLWVAGLAGALCLLRTAAAEDLGHDIDIPFHKVVLKNGLTLIVHEDHKAPIVAVNVWYHVGSKNEKPGKTGFAHLFEHLMFNGSEHFDDDYFKAVEPVGATDLNGTTNEDRTNYFQNAPKEALDLLLWLESDRMGHLLGAITQEKLDEQRGVVQNEKRQGENQPYGLAWERLTKAMYPVGHPYSWTVIGSMEDLNAASLDDVHEWFKTYYGAANATVVVAGDVDTDEVVKKVEHYFGDIPSGPPLVRHRAWIAKRSGSHREIAQDRVPQSRLYMAWNIPQWGSEAVDHLELAGDILANGKNSRLYKRLVYEDQIASDVQAMISEGEIGGAFLLMATARPGTDLADVEAAVRGELDLFLSRGPTRREVDRAQTEHVASFIRSAERIGGFGGKSDVLAENQVYGSQPDFYKTSLARIRAATPSAVRDAASEWLGDGVYILEIHPFENYSAAEESADRTSLPQPEIKAEVTFPELQRAHLDNGLKIILAERHAVPVIRFSLVVDSGYASDHGGKAGTAKLAMNMLDEGTRSRSSLEISDELARLGATLSAGSSLDSSIVTLSALKGNVPASLDIFADVVLNPSFPESELQRLRQEQLDTVKQEKSSPVAMALRVFPRLIYGSDHSYGNPFTGSGTDESVAAISEEDVRGFHTAWFRPNNATLVITGDTTLQEIQPRIEALFRKWKPGEVPAKTLTHVAPGTQSSVYLIDRPGSIQSVIIAGHVAPPKSYVNDLAMDAMNQVLGGSFTARINMNLREDKHWSYGARAVLPDARGQRPYILLAPVQTDKTKESMEEIKKEVDIIQGTQPITEEELKKVRNNKTLKLPGAWETIASVEDSILEIVQFALADDYFRSYPDKVRALQLADVQAEADTVLMPDRLIWVVVGDRSKIEEGIQSLNFGTIQFVDADGKPVK